MDATGNRRSFEHERKASRGPAWAAELLRRAAHCLADLSRIYHVADPPRAATHNPAVRTGFSSRDGSEPHRRLAPETSHTAPSECHRGDASAYRCYDDHRPFCHSALEPATAGAHAQHAKYVARNS